MTTIDKDDPRLTAYALGELDENERAAFEQVLANDPEARAEVDAIRAFGGELTGEMQKVATPALTDAQRAEIARACAPVVPLPREARSWWRLAPLSEVLVAAGLLGLAGVFTVQKFKSALQGAYSKGGTAIDTEITSKIPGGRSDWDQRVARYRQELAQSPERREVAEGQVARLTTLNTNLEQDLADLRAEFTAARQALREKELLLQETSEREERRQNASEVDAIRARMLVELQQRQRELEDERARMNMLQEAARQSSERTDPEKQRELARLIQELAEKAQAGASNPPPGVAPVSTTQPGEDKSIADRRALPPVQDNPFKSAQGEPLSTFSIDVDTAAYSALRSALQQRNALPAPHAVRIEELINYFPYDDAGPTTDEHPFATHVEVAGCPWKPANRLVRVAIKGREMQADRRPPTNLVFLVDVSGSMAADNKLPLVKRSLALLIEQLGPTDRVSMVVYAGASGLVLEPTPGDRKVELLAALDRLSAGGSTNGGAGIQLAYDVASRHFAEGGVNRVVLCTDGDWNVGVKSESELQALIEQKARSKVFLSVLGFGMSHDDAKLELLADKGNGNYAFVDTLAEGRKVLVDQLTGTLVTIAKDVKVQVDWNPAAVKSYRLIGYENRVLAAKDFADDTKDAGEIGAGHSVTALYEIEPVLDHDEPPALMTLRLRYKLPEGDVSKLIERSGPAGAFHGASFDQASTDFRFAAAVASFGMLLRDSPHRGQSSLALVEELANGARGHDRHGHRAEFVELVKLARKITGR